MTCPGCLEPLPGDCDPRRRTCSAQCRQRVHRQRHTAWIARARELMQRQTAALIAGDAAALAAVVEDAERFFAPS
jgi:acyl transferase domain-containing protein